MVVRFGLLMALLCLSLNSFANGFSAQVDRFSIGMGDHIQLVLTLGDIRGQRPDISALDKDFTIIRKSQSSSMNINNGVVSQEIKWVYLLAPNRKGTLTIPSFTSGSFKSEAIDIEVGDAPVSQSSTDDVLLEVEVKPLNPYVKGQAIYTQRLFYAKQLVNSASLSEPTLEKGDAEVVFLSSSNPKYVKRNNRTYNMIERYFSVFPSSEGELLFAPSVFRGSIADEQQQRQRGFNMPMFNTGKRVTAYSSKASLKVQGQAKGFTGNNWLPSSQVSLDMTWSQSPETVKAGEPVTVTIMLMAQGLKAESLPEVKLNWPDSIKTYPEKPEFRTDKRGNGLLGLRQEKVVMVANQNGEFQIPAIEIPWWNTITNEQQVERVASFTVKVTGAGAVQATTPTQETPMINSEVDNETPSVEKETQPEKELSLLETLTATYVENKKHLPIALAVLCLLLALLVSIVFYLKRPKAKQDNSRQILAAAKAQLAEACNANDAKGAIAALSKWAEAMGIYPATLSGIERSGDKALSTEIALLSEASYSKSAQAWSGANLLVAVNNFAYNEQPEVNNQALGSLHPQH